MQPSKAENTLQWLEDLYQQNASHVYKIAFYILQDPVEAEDVCHDVFLDLIQHPEKFDPLRGSIKAWLAVKTRNRAIDRLRKLKRRRYGSVYLPEPAAVESCDPTAESVLAKLEIDCLHESLRNLPQPQREALAATYFRSLRQNEWARLTGYPLGTVKSRVRYGVNNIRKQFVQMGWLEP